jgi:hypothetical protein
MSLACVFHQQMSVIRSHEGLKEGRRKKFSRERLCPLDLPAIGRPGRCRLIVFSWRQCRNVHREVNGVVSRDAWTLRRRILWRRQSRYRSPEQ